MRYYLPDAQDLVDPSFDFEKETRSRERLRQRDDLYAHEVFGEPAFDGILVSKGIVDGTGGAGGRYSIGQRQRLLRMGVRDFFRLKGGYRETLPVLGDCGAFSYVNEERPPYTVDEVLRFYDDGGFDGGISLDHVILGFDDEWDQDLSKAPQDFRDRQEITLELAAEFLREHAAGGLRFKPLGVAQGWSPASYARAVDALQKIGYDYIAVGGMVPLKTPQVVESLVAIDQVRKKSTRLHLLGITRLEELKTFEKLGAVSFDSTSPLRRAFKDKKHNYYTLDRTYMALRVPQVDGNPRMQRKIAAGRVNQGRALRLEKACLDAVREFDAGSRKSAEVASLLVEFEHLLGERKDNSEPYREVLEASPWKGCPCEVCKRLGHHVILFRGAERNRRRGFHNTWVFYRQLQQGKGVAMGAEPSTDQRTPRQLTLPSR